MTKQKPGREVDLSVPLTDLPRWVLGLSLVMLAVPLLIFTLVYGVNYTLSNLLAWWQLPEFILLILLHEGIHALTWKFASGLRWSDFTFGFKWEALAPYCHAKQPMRLPPYRLGAVMPLILTGLLPWGAAIATQNAPLAVLSSVMISAGVGDVFVLWQLRDLPASAEVRDHPENAGCIAYLPEE